MSDSISREAVLEIVNSIKACISIDGYWAILERVRALPPVEPQEWIIVKDRLPKKGGTYYVTIQDKNGYRYVAKDRFYYDHKYFKHINYYKCLDSEIIAWQPIIEPSPYKGE